MTEMMQKVKIHNSALTDVLYTWRILNSYWDYFHIGIFKYL